MLELLQTMGYRPPVIQPGRYGNVEIAHMPEMHRYNLLVNGQQWMSYQYHNHEEAYDVFSHYCLARGHVITTGLGYGVRESWLLSKPDVTRLTVIEKHQSVIDYHVAQGTAWLDDPRVEIVQADAERYCASCDVLLLDHWEFEQFPEILASAAVVQNNISCDTLWFWPLERIIMHCRKWHSDNDPGAVLLTKQQALEKIRENHGLHRLPRLSEQQTDMMCMMFNSKIFSRSEDFLQTYFADRDLYHEIYRMI